MKFVPFHHRFCHHGSLAFSLRAQACLLILLLAILPSTTPAEVLIAEKGQARTTLILQPGATIAEIEAARELAQTLTLITGAEFPLSTNADTAPESAILIGPGPLAEKYFPGIVWKKLGDEEALRRTAGGRLLLAGGRPRGTRYAVNRFLEEQGAVRRWTPWAATVPKNPDLRVPDLNRQEKPAFEYREPFWFSAFDGDWAARNYYNGNSARVTPAQGGKVSYQGFVHTFYPLVPPETYFKDHPEWYSQVKGKRTKDRAQLCLTNPQLRDFVVDRVRAWLKESPEASIISISQNDWQGACECRDCQMLDDAEGSHAGTMITFVNYVAEKLEPEFPFVAFDTLAYQYTRHPPKTVRPRSNVIVRLCSIECNFSVPLDYPENAKFGQDLLDWSHICRRLYIWDYVTDFSHFVQPHPNWFVLGQNLRFFAAHNVRGVFEEGAFPSNGAEMAELRAWVLAHLLWNPQQDDKALIQEFLDGYYGPAAGKIIAQYMKDLSLVSRGHNLTCFGGTDAPFLKFTPLSHAEQLWQAAEAAVKDDPEKLWRARQAHLPVQYVWLARWTKLQQEAKEAGVAWPLPASRKAVADAWLATATGPGPVGWSKMTTLREAGLTPEAFVAQFAVDPPVAAATPADKK